MNRYTNTIRTSAPAYRRQAFAVKNNWQQNTRREKTETYLSGRQANGNKMEKSPSGPAYRRQGFRGYSNRL